MRPDVIVIDLDMRDESPPLVQLECAVEDIVPVVALSLGDWSRRGPPTRS